MIKRLLAWLKSKPQGEDTTTPHWPFDKPEPIAKPKRRPQVKKTRPLPSKATIAKKAVGKKTTVTKVNK